MGRRITVDQQTRLQYAGLYLLKLVQDPEIDSDEILAEDEELLTPILSSLVERDYAYVGDDDRLRITGKGSDVVEQFSERYQRFLRDFDVFCAVDLETGDFAFAYYDDFTDRDEWELFLSEERWDDLRIAVGEYEGIDSVEIVFMSLVQDNRYGWRDDGWDYDLLLGKIWDEIARICNNAVRLEDLAYQDGGEQISAEVVIQDIIQQGRGLIERLRR